MCRRSIQGTGEREKGIVSRGATVRVSSKRRNVPRREKVMKRLFGISFSRYYHTVCNSPNIASSTQWVSKQKPKQGNRDDMRERHSYCETTTNTKSGSSREKEYITTTQMDKRGKNI